jgi:hypothetical protein
MPGDCNEKELFPCWYNDGPLPPLRSLVVICVLAAGFCSAPPADAQEPPPPIPRFVIDLHGTFTTFPADLNLALSRGLNQAELPGRAFGGDVAAHVYPFKYRAVTFGLGGRITTSRARRSQTEASALRPVTERFTYLGPQLSFNFGTGAGWSYISGGIAAATWSVVPDGAIRQPADEQRLRTIDYGGGARWFAKPRLAFSFDVRLYAINPGSPGALATGPRTTLFVIGAGVSIK